MSHATTCACLCMSPALTLAKANALPACWCHLMQAARLLWNAATGLLVAPATKCALVAPLTAAAAALKGLKNLDGSFLVGSQPARRSQLHLRACSFWP